MVIRNPDQPRFSRSRRIVEGTHEHVDIVHSDQSMSFPLGLVLQWMEENLRRCYNIDVLQLRTPLLNIGMESLHKQNCSNDGNLAPPHTEQVSMLKRGAGMRRHAIEDACYVGGARFPPSTVWSDFNWIIIPRVFLRVLWRIEVWAQLCLVLNCYGGLTWAFRGLIQHII